MNLTEAVKLMREGYKLTRRIDPASRSYLCVYKENETFRYFVYAKLEGSDLYEKLDGRDEYLFGVYDAEIEDWELLDQQAIKWKN